MVMVNALRSFRPRFLLSALLVLLIGNILPSSADAVPGAPKQGFSRWITGDIYAIAEQADGKILVGGNLIYQNDKASSYIGRYHPDGSVDTTFQTTAAGSVTSIILDAQGRIYIAGSFTHINDQPRRAIARLLADGSLDSAFDPDLGTAYIASRLAIQPDGQLLLGLHQRGLRRISPAGVVDANYTVTYTGTPWALCPQHDGSVIMGGDFTVLNGSPASHLARLLPDGTTDPNWTCTANNAVFAIVPDVQGNLLVGGSFTTLGGSTRSRLGRVNSSGVVDGSFNPAPNSSVHSILPLANGQILVGGNFSSIGGATRSGVVCLTSAGTADTSWANMGMPSTLALCLQKSGHILVGRTGHLASGLQYPSLKSFEGSSITSELQVDSPGSVTWTRNGFTSHLLEAILESSADHGATWTTVGSMTRTGNNWQTNVGTLADGTLLRARGRVTGGYTNSSCFWTYEYLVTGTTAPEVKVTVEGGSELTDGTGTLTFPSATAKKRLIIENTGTTMLILGAPALSSSYSFGLDLQSFQPLLAPGASTTVDIEFAPPISTGSATQATLKLPTNDADEAVFDIALSGSATISARAALGLLELNWSEPGAGSLSRAYVDFGFHPEWTTYSINIPANLMNPKLRLYTQESEPHPYETTFRVNGTRVSYEDQLTLSKAATQTLTIVATAPDEITTRTYQVVIRREAAVTGDVDLGFQSPQTTGHSITFIAPQPDGSMVVGGSLGTFAGQPRTGLAKITPEGTLIPDYAPAGSTPLTSILTTENGSILAAGYRFGNQSGYARILNSGLFDPSLPSYLSYSSSSYSQIIPDGDGFVLTGRHRFMGGAEKFLSRFHWNGQLDLTFEQDYSATFILAMVKLPSGRFLAGHSNGLTVYDRFGEIRQTLPFTGSVNVILPLPDGGFMIGGDFKLTPTDTGFKIARLHADLTRDTTFLLNGSIKGRATTLALQADGKVLVGGCSIETAAVGFKTTTSVVRLLTNGKQDTTFSTGGEPEYYEPVEVNNLTLRRDGKILLAGRFNFFNGVSDKNITLLLNDPATESLEVTSRQQVTWLRGGSSPEAMRTQFSLSRDGGSTWTDLGLGQHISGGWSLPGLSLPASGRIRAHAHISVGLNNASTGILESTLDFNFAGEEVTIVDDNAQGVSSGSTLEFGQIGTTLGAQNSMTITIRNDGSADLTGIAAAASGAAQTDFSIQTPLPSTLAPGASAGLTIVFTPKALDLRQAALMLTSSDGDEPAITLALQGTGIASSAFTVQTGATKQVTISSAVLQGTAKASGITRQLFFDYGPTAALGTTVAATPDTATGTAVVNASATLTGLRPGFTYHYRIRGESAVGNAIGTTRTFRTLALPKPTGIQVSGVTQAPPEGAQLVLAVTAPDQVWWGITGLPAWITTTLPLAPGSASIVLNVLPNMTAAARQAKLVIGGVNVTVSQTAVTAKPVIAYFATGVDVGTTFARQITVGNQPATLTVKGLPPGLALSADGWIRGVFDQIGSYTVSITAKNGRGSAMAEWYFDVEEVDRFERVAGSYMGLVPRDTVLNRGLASRFDMTVTASGGYSGKLTTGTTSTPFAGRLVINSDGTDFTATLPIPGGAQELTGAFPFYGYDPHLRLRLQTLDGSTVSHFYSWKATTTTTYLANLALMHPQTGLDIPFGSGYLACAATKTSKNMVLCTGRLGDGTPLTFSTPLGTNGMLCLYQSLPSEGGTLAGVYRAGATANTASWLKLPPLKPLPQDAYAAGFGPVDLTIQGGTPAAMTPGSIRPGATATLSFSHSPLNLTETTFTVPFQIVNPSAKGVTNTAKFTASTNPNTVAMPTYKPVTGAFTGTFTLKGATTATNRKVTFQGLLVPVGTGFVGHGYFMLPISTVKNAPQASGRVTIMATP